MGVAKAGNGGSGVERLTDAQVRNAKPDPDKAIRKLSDGRGLYLAVMPTGSKLWRMKYRIGGKEKTYSIGAYPEVSLADARDECTAARDWLRNGKDPVTARKVHRATALSEQQTIFAALSAEWLPLQPFSPGHRKHQQALLDNDLLPYLGKLPVAEISPAIALEVLRKVERRGALETAAKCRRLMSQIFRFAVQTSRATGDPAALLSGAIRTPDTKHRATVPGKDMPALFKAMAAVPAELNTKLAFYWLVLTAARTVEMRFATWGEIDGNLWRVPAARMKMRREHVVPLSIQAQQVLVRARAAHRPRRRRAAVSGVHPARRAVGKRPTCPPRPRGVLRPADGARFSCCLQHLGARGPRGRPRRDRSVPRARLGQRPHDLQPRHLLVEARDAAAGLGGSGDGVGDAAALTTRRAPIPQSRRHRFP